MILKRGVLLAALALMILSISVGCGGFPQIIVSNNQPTAVPTRTPRPTFTPRPAETDTPLPTDTPAPTDTLEPTEEIPTATRQVVARATNTRRPTSVPVTLAPTQPPPPTSPPQPTKSPFQFSFIPATSCSAGDGDTCNIQNGVKCLHSSGHRIKALVYANYRDPGSALAGAKVRFSFARGGAPIDPDETTGGDGKAEKTLSGPGDTSNAGTYFAWVISNSGAQLSEYSPAIVINNKNQDDPATCVEAVVAFAGGK